MARAHNLVIKSPTTDLETIVLRSLEGLDTIRHDRFTVEGPRIGLSSRQVIGVALALHEFATNAIKYGACTSPAGIVRIFWTIESTSARRVHLHWEERGGPPVSPPTHRGFGTQLIERVCAHELDGTVAVDYASEGLNAVISFPLTQ